MPQHNTNRVCIILITPRSFFAIYIYLYNLFTSLWLGTGGELEAQRVTGDILEVGGE